MTETVSVIIPCHNYGRFLAECVESVQSQTHPVHEIIVVDDRSTDNTPRIARMLKGVDYMYVDNGYAMRTRKDGLDKSTGEFVIFLDADDVLLPNYIEEGMRQFRERTGIVYSDLLQFGDDERYRPMNYNAETFQQANTLHSGCIVRRAAIEATMALDRPVVQLAEDWHGWKPIINAGWLVAKNPIPYRYRRHGESQTKNDHYRSYRNLGYFGASMEGGEPITLFVPLSGRWFSAGRLQAFLEQQTYPRELMQLILFNTSQDERFTRQAKDWVAECDYKDVRHCEFDLKLPKGLADMNRRNPEVRRQVQIAATRIYTQMKQMVQTEYVWIVEDDVIPPNDAAIRLLREFNPDVGAVSGAYKSRFHNAYLAWLPGSRHLRSGHGVEQVEGTGFGCVVLRKSLLEQSVFTHQAKFADYDPNWFDWLSRYRRNEVYQYKALINWDVECDHLEQGGGNASSDLDHTFSPFSSEQMYAPLINGGLVMEAK